LLALRLLGEIRDKYGAEIPARRLFETPTIEGLAARLSEQARTLEPAGNFLVPVQRGEPPAQPLFLVPGGWGGEIEFLVYGELSRQIDPTRPVWGLKARGAGTRDVPHASVNEMAADYLREIRRIQPHGPYLLAGECVGGICAYEMACQLENAGEQVALLVLLDTVVPTESHLNNYLDAEMRKRDAEAQQFSVHRRIRHHLDQMAGLSLGRKFGYVFNKAFRHENAEHRFNMPTAEHHPRGQKDYPVILLRHRLKPYSRTVALLLDEESSRFHGQLGWDKAGVAHVEPHVLPGTHLTYIRENGAAAAAKLRELLTQATTNLHHAPVTI